MIKNNLGKIIILIVVGVFLLIGLLCSKVAHEKARLTGLTAWQCFWVDPQVVRIVK
jgi:hypothetical protein